MNSFMTAWREWLLLCLAQCLLGVRGWNHILMQTSLVLSINRVNCIVLLKELQLFKIVVSIELLGVLLVDGVEWLGEFPLWLI